MFIRVKSTPNSPRQSVQIVESVRVGDLVKQKIVRYVGIAMNEDELQKLKDLASHIMATMLEEAGESLFPSDTLAQDIIASRAREEDDKPLPVNLKNLREEKRVNTGFHEVYGALYDELGFNRLLGARRVASSRILRDVVLARVAKPQSKLASAETLCRDFGIEINANQIYRMMDHIDDKHIARINDFVGVNALRVLGEKVDVMFYDCTTLYFESFTEDELRQKGFSKDHKSQETQVLLALLVTSAGLPIGYRLYPGATWEGHTLKLALEDIAKYAKIAKVVVVADSGLFSKDNLVQLGDQPFIVAARLKNLPTALVDKITNLENFQDSVDGGKHYETSYLGQRLIVTWSAKRAKKDAHDRERALEKLLKRYDGKPCKSLVVGGYAKYLRVEGEGKVLLDEAKIAQASRWDGLHGMITNVAEMSVEQALEQYRGLWQVEETFRLSKHDLSMRPMFHWTPKRIKAHVAICFMALTCIRHMEYQCALRYTKLSPEVIREELAHVQVSILKDKTTQKRYGIPSKLGVHTRKLFGLLGKKISTTPFEITRN